MRLALALMLAMVAVTIVGSSEEPMKVVQASEVLAKIKAGEPVEYDHVTIEGNLSLDQLGLPIKHTDRTWEEINWVGFSENETIVNSSITINNSRIEDAVAFDNIILYGMVINFENTEFLGKASFKGSHFYSSANFRGAKFKSDVNFRGTQFYNFTNFSRSQFNNSAVFWVSHFNSTADFNNSKFNSTANFRGSQFNSYAGFHSKFNGDADFSSSTFNSTADFRESLFIKNVYFTGSYLKNLNLTSTDYEKMYIRWGNIDSLVYDDKFGDTTYQLLMQNFRNLGFLPDADSCYYQFRKEQCLHRDLFKDPFMLLLDLGGWIFYGYGKKPLYPLGWSVGSILVFGAFWYIVDRSDHKNTIDEYSFVWDRTFDKNHHETSRGGRIYSVLKQFVFSATIFLSGTRLFVDPPEIPTSPKWSRSFIKGMFTLERVLGAFFSILLFLAIGGTVVR